MTGSDHRPDEGDDVARFASTRHAGGDFSAPDPCFRDKVAAIRTRWDEWDTIADDPLIAAWREEARDRYDRVTAARRSRQKTWAGATLTAAAVGLVALLWRPTGEGGAVVSAMAAPAVLENGRAAPLNVRLGDGSSVVLDAETRLRLPAGRDGRRVVVERGRAFFNVRHDAAHPFEVLAGGLRITDLGTQFETDFRGQDVVVALVEGRVAVAARGLAPVDMTPGTRLSLLGGRWVLAAASSPGRGWRDAMLTVDNRPLGEVVAELNRYQPQPLVVDPRAARTVRLSGAFRVDHPEDVIDAVTAMGFPGAVRRALAHDEGAAG